LLAQSLGGDGGRPGNLVTLEQQTVNNKLFGIPERAVRGAVKGGWSVKYSVEPKYGFIPVDLEDGKGLQTVRDPIPRTISISGAIVGRNRVHIDQFLGGHVNHFTESPLKKKADLTMGPKTIDNVLLSPTMNDDPFRKDMAKRFLKEKR